MSWLVRAEGSAYLDTGTQASSSGNTSGNTKSCVRGIDRFKYNLHGHTTSWTSPHPQTERLTACSNHLNYILNHNFPPLLSNSSSAFTRQLITIVFHPTSHHHSSLPLATSHLLQFTNHHHGQSWQICVYLHANGLYHLLTRSPHSSWPGRHKSEQRRPQQTLVF